MIRVVLVDDHKLFRQGLGVMLAAKENIQVIEKFDSAVALLDALPSLEVDLILLDIDMPGLDGISAVPKILKIQSQVKIIMLSMHLSSSKIQDAVAAKVNGYLLKTVDDDEVSLAIETVMQGRDFFSQEAHSTLIESFRRKDDPNFIELTPREKEILKLVCEEMQTQEIADALKISVHTAETHRRNLLSKTGCRNSVGLVKYAIESGLI
ncbi:MAG: response regulator transcription factor [Vicingaceae bacterium]